MMAEHMRAVGRYKAASPMKLPYTDFDTDIENGAGPATALFINPRVPRPTPAKGQCLVKIHVFGLNRMDLS